MNPRGGEWSSSSRIRCQNGATMQASHRGLHESESKWRKLGRATAGRPKKFQPSCTCSVNQDSGGCAPLARRLSQIGWKNAVRIVPTHRKKKYVADWKKQPHENHTTL